MIMKEELATERQEGSMLVPFLVGGLVGAGIALLLAPKSGKELRKDIRDISSNTKEKIVTTVEKGRELFDGSRSAIKTAIDAGKNAYVEEIEKHRQAA
jgi:gas vesicle protein